MSPANMPALTSTSVLWVRVTHNGTTVAVKCADSEAGLSSAADCYSSSALRTTGGMLGFRPLSSTAQIDDLTIKSYNPATSSFDVIEQQEFFTLDANGYAEETLAHDANGNLTYDGVHRYSYDAWNRLVRIAKAYRDSSNTLQSGQTFETIRYDGRGRRISKSLTGTGQWDATYHYYYDSDSLIETRNGSNQVLKQQVWGVQYIDELIQISVNDDPDDGTESTCESSYWVCQDANFNVLGIVDASGILKERYEYIPYGQRTVFFSPGVNDPGCYSPTLASRRVITTLGTMPYGLNEFGHQGLMHDQITDTIDNRGRVYHTVLMRMMQTDPWQRNPDAPTAGDGYQDGMNLYEYMGSSPLTRLDPTGQIIILDVIGLADNRRRQKSVPPPPSKADRFWDHYLNGPNDPNNSNRRTPIKISFSEVDTSGVRPTDFSQVQSILKQGDVGTHQIDDKMAFSTRDEEAYYLGNITLRLQGNIEIDDCEKWSFDGTLKSFDDLYDFNSSNHRGISGEILTGYGRARGGSPT